MDVHVLTRLDNHFIPNNQAEVRVFMSVRDEMLRLPQTLDHYRRLGVARFFITDNGSVDGSREFLLGQPDCHVFITNSSYSDATYGLRWQEALLNQFGVNRWCLTVDADEWFVFPGCESKTLKEFAHYLDHVGVQGVFAFLLDMYGSGTLAEPACTLGDSLLEVCPYFDRTYMWRRRLHIPGLERRRFPEYTIVGGPRLRLLFPSYRRYEYLIRTIWRLASLAKISLPVGLRPPPSLTKIPFLRWLPGTRYVTPHSTIPIKLAAVTGVLLHFKFLRDFSTRVNTELTREQNRAHGIWATELGRYMKKLRDDPLLSFYYSDSLAYKGSEQLLQLGLLKEDAGWNGLRSTETDPKGDLD